MQRQRWQQQPVAELKGCQPLRCLPKKWFPPFGLDKLKKVIEAESSRTYPLLMLKEHEKYEDTYAQWGGPTYVVLTRDPRNLRVILSRKFKDFEIGSGRNGCVGPLLGDGIFTQDGPKWEHSRKLLAPLIQRSTLPDLGLVEKDFQRLLAKITPKDTAPDNRARHWCVNLKEALFELSLEIMTEFLLGDPHRIKNKETNAADWAGSFAKEFNTAFRWISKRERLKGFYWMIDGREFRDSCRAAQRMIKTIVNQCSQAFEIDGLSLNDEYVALAALLQEETDTGMVRDQFVNLLLAGRDTTGSLLSWVFYALSREPELFKEMKAEMTETLSSNKYGIQPKAT
ncbi:MAG: hypothetical protein M1820_010496 [Bogoriella megaspora]|nr:MAG: hypothetical protein M1820_010496 [Bogoriella megaspora]